MVSCSRHDDNRRRRLVAEESGDVDREEFEEEGSLIRAMTRITVGKDIGNYDDIEKLPILTSF